MRDDIIWSKIKTYHDLDLPPDSEDAPRTQAWDFKPRENFLFLNASKTKYGPFSYVAVMQATRDTSAKYQFVHIGTNDQIFLSDWQINKLVRAGRIRPILGPGDGPRNVPGSSYNLTPGQQKKARKKLAYANGFEEFMRANDLWTLTDEQKAAIVKEVAEKIGDKAPPRRSGWYKIIKIARTGNQYDRLVSFADNDAAKGNRTARYGVRSRRRLRMPLRRPSPLGVTGKLSGRCSRHGQSLGGCTSTSAVRSSTMTASATFRTGKFNAFWVQ